MTADTRKSGDRPISLMIVDDSGFMRLALRKMLERDSGIRIVADAASGEEAVRLNRTLQPDVITMDVEMPGLGGLEATRRILADRRCAVIVVSSQTHTGADVTMQAMDCGAVDFIPKVSSFVDLDIVNVERELLRKVHFWAGRPASVQSKTNNTSAAPSPRVQPMPRAALKPADTPDLIAIGASTGGPRLIPQLFQQLPHLSCPVIIALHMPPVYTHSFAEHLKAVTGHNAMEATDGMRLEPGMVVVAPGGTDTFLASRSGHVPHLRLADNPEALIHPSVNALFQSVAENARSPVAVVLTGMGEDGKVGAEALARRQAPVLAQCAEDCLVYGMSRAVIESGAASESLNLDGIITRLARWAGGDASDTGKGDHHA